MKTVKKLWFEEGRIFITNARGETLSQPLLFFPRLQNAGDDERAGWTESPFGLHWEKLDEDISFESFTWADDDPHSFAHAMTKQTVF